jgi:hypothetical protein
MPIILCGHPSSLYEPLGGQTTHQCIGIQRSPPCLPPHTQTQHTHTQLHTSHLLWPIAAQYINLHRYACLLEEGHK